MLYEVITQAAIEANEKQKKKMVDKIVKNMESLEGKTVAILGLSFKPETDDMRDVITSYSIHYTKLYDIYRGIRHGQREKGHS